MRKLAWRSLGKQAANATRGGIYADGSALQEMERNIDRQRRGTIREVNDLPNNLQGEGSTDDRPKEEKPL